MKRRDFITLLGRAAAAWPLAARAQQPALPVVGFLHSQTPEGFAPFVAAFRRGLGEMGFIEPRNLAIEFRWAYEDNSRLPALAADLVQRRVAVIVVASGANGAIAAKRATATIPIVFASGVDPVQLGLVASLNRPGGNATGIIAFSEALITKRLELLCELVPMTTVVGVLTNASGRGTDFEVASVEAAARRIGRQLRILAVTGPDDFEGAFATILRERISALLVQNNVIFTNSRERLVALTARYAVPASYEPRQFAEAGGLFSYGSNTGDIYRQIGIYTARILKGDKPADLPVTQPTKFELVINLKTAKALGLAVPVWMQQLADDVIE